MPKIFDAYIGLFRSDGTEPPAESGYVRAYVGAVNILDALKIPSCNDIVFNEVKDPGYGAIENYMLFDCPEGGEPLALWHLPAAVNAHEGTIPVIHNGKLLLGVDVSAKIQLFSEDMCSAVKQKGGV